MLLTAIEVVTINDNTSSHNDYTHDTYLEYELYCCLLPKVREDGYNVFGDTFHESRRFEIWFVDGCFLE